MRINYLAVLVAAIAHFLVGGLWYGLLFGNKFVELIGWEFSGKTSPNGKPQPHQGNGACVSSGDYSSFGDRPFYQVHRSTNRV